MKIKISTYCPILIILFLSSVDILSHVFLAIGIYIKLHIKNIITNTLLSLMIYQNVDVEKIVIGQMELDIVNINLHIIYV